MTTKINKKRFIIIGAFLLIGVTLIIGVSMALTTGNVTFDARGGSPSNQTANVVYGETYREALNSVTTPTRPGYRFDGWYVQQCDTDATHHIVFNLDGNNPNPSTMEQVRIPVTLNQPINWTESEIRNYIYNLRCSTTVANNAFLGWFSNNALERRTDGRLRPTMESTSWDLTDLVLTQQDFDTYGNGSEIAFHAFWTLLGDFNDDGVVDEEDVEMILKYMMIGHFIGMSLPAGDVNCDGFVNTEDWAIVSDYVNNVTDTVIPMLGCPCERILPTPTTREPECRWVRVTPDTIVRNPGNHNIYARWVQESEIIENVPDTLANIPNVVYIVGGVLILGGLALIVYISKNKKEKQN